MELLFVLSSSAAILFLGMHTGHCSDIINGEVSVPHSRPYMAALLTRGNIFICGGTLISGDWVLTAAHCNINRGDTVILGAHSLSNSYEKGKQTFHIIQAIRHRYYNRKTLENDIMLLQLNRRAIPNRFVRTIKLPGNDDDVRAGTWCLVAGWGKTENGGQSPDTLHEVHVSVMDRRICNNKNHYNRHAVTINMICAGDVNNQRKDACEGDSGGPLICGEIQRGITSFGEPGKCGDPKYPGVYTRLTKDYVEWVKKVIY